MATRANDALRSYTELTSSLLERWSKPASKVAARRRSPRLRRRQRGRPTSLPARRSATEGGFLLGSTGARDGCHDGRLPGRTELVESDPSRRPREPACSWRARSARARDSTLPERGQHPAAPAAARRDRIQASRQSRGASWRDVRRDGTGIHRRDGRRGGWVVAVLADHHPVSDEPRWRRRAQCSRR